MSKQWIVNAGIRFDDFSRDQVGGPGINAPGSAAANTAIATNTASVQANLLSWNAGLVYKPIPIASFYVAYATSESPIGSELDSTGAQYNGISATLVNVPPQEARSVEVGTKWELFDKRLLATAALFQTDVDHARTNDTVTVADPTNAFAGKYRVRGIELTTAGNITKALERVRRARSPRHRGARSSNPQDIGRRLANIPLTQFSLLSRYQLTDQLAIAGSATYGGEIYGGHLAANAANNHTVDWWRFDAFAEYKLTNNIELKVSGLNLTNELYYDAIYQATGHLCLRGPWPRRVSHGESEILRPGFSSSATSVSGRCIAQRRLDLRECLTLLPIGLRRAPSDAHRRERRHGARGPAVAGYLTANFKY